MGIGRGSRSGKGSGSGTSRFTSVGVRGGVGEGGVVSSSKEGSCCDFVLLFRCCYGCSYFWLLLGLLRSDLPVMVQLRSHDCWS